MPTVHQVLTSDTARCCSSTVLALLILATLTSATTPGIVHRSSVIIPPRYKPAGRILRDRRLIIWRGSALLPAVGAVARAVGQLRSTIDTIAHFFLLYISVLNNGHFTVREH